jgi:hypothetical protein
MIAPNERARAAMPTAVYTACERSRSGLPSIFLRTGIGVIGDRDVSAPVLGARMRRRRWNKMIGWRAARVSTVLL